MTLVEITMLYAKTHDFSTRSMLLPGNLHAIARQKHVNNGLKSLLLEPNEIERNTMHLKLSRYKILNYYIITKTK